MPAGDILPLLLMLLGLIAVGQLLRLLALLPPDAPDVLARIIVQVTMPALIVVILARARFEPALLPALVATTLALLAALALGALWLRLLGADRPAQGSAGLVSAFSNTAFLGLPFILARYPGSILLLTLGVAFATAMASQRPPIVPGPRLPRIARALARLLLRPMIVAVLLGLALALADLPLPDLLAAPLTQVGQATPTLAFLTIGLGLDLRSLRGHALALAGIAGIKLLVMPALVAGILLALEVRGDVAHAAVLQAAMPTAVVSAIIASDAGCDPRLASAAAVVTPLLALATLPLIAACLPAIGL